ncbi:helix-turn-helix domain-containing protein [Streptomyces sp. NPDC058287]
MPPARLGRPFVRPGRPAVSQCESFARRSGVSATTVSAMETGKTQVSVSLLRVIASPLHATVAELIDRDVTGGRGRVGARRSGPVAPTGRPALPGCGQWSGLTALRPVVDRSRLRRHHRVFVETGYHRATVRTVVHRADMGVPGVTTNAAASKICWPRYGIWP